MAGDDKKPGRRESDEGSRGYTHEEMKQLRAQMLPDDEKRADNPRKPGHHRTVTLQAKHSSRTMGVGDGIQGPLHPVAGHCLCEDFWICIQCPRAGTILCHCVDCQINGASFFGAYVVTDSRSNIIIVPQNRDYGDLRDPELGVYDAQPVSSGTSCPRTFCKTCGTMLFAEPATLKGIVVANAGLFQNHGRHPALVPRIEIFTSTRLKWIATNKSKRSTETTEFVYNRMPKLDEEGAPIREEFSDSDEGEEGSDASMEDDEEDTVR